MDIPVPILVTAFNRPNLLRKCLEELSAFPNEIYVYIDGARTGYPHDEDLVNQCYAIALQFTQNPSFVKLSQINRGCNKAVASAIDAMFLVYERLIIVEDDILLNSDALYFLEHGLRFYSDDFTIAAVSAVNYVPKDFISDPSLPIRLSNYAESWAWATWRNRWSLFIENGPIKLDFFDVPSEIRTYSTWRVWNKIFRQTYEGNIDSWAYRWLFTNWKLGKRFVVSNQNLISNLGFGCNATHTKGLSVLPPVQKLNRKILTNAPIAQLDKRADAWLTKTHFQTNLISRVKFFFAKTWSH
jgi:hypothetical protein